jgi:hypothetical protein
MRTIQLNKGKVALVSDSDFKALSIHTWRAVLENGTWYAATSLKKANGGDIRKSPIKMHVLLMRERLGPLIDHKDCNGLNNQRSNLRAASKSENAANARAHRDGSSKFKGVTWDKQTSKWRAMIFVKGKAISIGRFQTEEVAAAAYNRAALDHFGEFARLNVFEVQPPNI